MENKSNKIRKQRKSLTYSTKELADLSKVPEHDIIAYESNKKTATPKTIKKIADATRTNISNWVDDDYFKRSRRNAKATSYEIDEGDEKIFDKGDKEAAVCCLRAMFRADDVMDTLYDALIDMEDMKMTEDGELEFSEFGKKVLTSVCSMKLKKVFTICNPKDSRDSKSSSASTSIVKGSQVADRSKIPLNLITFNNLLQELKIMFRNTDTLEIIIQALTNIGCIDDDGRCSEKSKLLLNTVMANKVKNVVNNR